MDAKAIQELIELLSRSHVKSLELERKDFKLKLVKEDAGVIPAVQMQAVPLPAKSAETTPSAGAAPADSEGSGANGLYELNSPIVGTFYSAPGPDAPPFVKVGAHVSKGQVLCIVEAMKVMNEIESEIDAEIAEVLVSNGQPVEYGEVLYRMRPVSR